MSSTKGGCRCGKIRFVAEGEAKWVGHCHCGECRNATGSGFTTYVGWEKDRVKFSGDGEGTLYVSSEGVKRHFCEKCGSPISYEGSRWPGEIHFFIGVFDDPEVFEPTGHAYVEERLSWAHLAGDLPEHSDAG